jgi:hypothetical protein
MRSTLRRPALIVATICGILFPFVCLVGYEDRSLEKSSNLVLFPNSELATSTEHVRLVAVLLGLGFVFSLLAAAFSGQQTNLSKR